MTSNSSKDHLPRLNKAIAARGVCSRRKADDLILNGHVKINGEVVTNPSTRLSEEDELEIDGKIYEPVNEYIYRVFNKPAQCVCTLSDPQNRKTIVDYYPADLLQKRVFPVGRLDYFSEGLLILTNDGDLANSLMHPSNDKIKVYEVLIRGKVDQRYIKEMEEGMILEDGVRLRPIRINSSTISNNTLLRLELRQGINRQIRRMCAKCNLVILRLRRIQEDIIFLADLEPGKMRNLTDKELKSLMRIKNKKI